MSVGIMTSRRQNEIIYMVNCRVPKEEAELKNDEENEFYDSLVKEATEMEEKYGKWPVFEMSEQNWEEIPDIYNEEL